MSVKKLSGKPRPLQEGKRTWIEIDRRAALHNYRVFRRLAGDGPKLWAVVKSNAYGHGIFLCAKLFSSFGVDGFCVDSLIEGLNLRKAGIKKPILVLGPTLAPRMSEAAGKNIVLTISTFEGLHQLRRLRRPPAFHIKVDTGMHRQGFYPEALPEIMDLMNASPRLAAKWQGLYTHFASANGEPSGRKECEEQYRKFMELKAMCEREGYAHLIFHAANTGATMLDPRYHLDAVRVGIGLYGHLPAPAFRLTPSLRPMLSWRTVVTETKPLSIGDRIGYDLTERVRRPASLGILPVGYWHGLPRALSKNGGVLIRGQRAKIMGRISMDLTAVDATLSKARSGDVATIIGRDGKKEISAEELAEESGTIAYEFLTRLNPLIERIIK
jgi:alanine racemase